MMKKHFKSILFLIILSAFSTSGIAANENNFDNLKLSLATAPPIVSTPVYLCQNSLASPLTAVPSAGGTLNWYFTTSPTEVPSAIAPIPSTTTVGTTTYYVAETVAGIESTPRTSIVVNVVADTVGGLTLFCDAANSTPTSAAFDWNNVTGYLGYNYSYSVAGGPVVTGFQVAPSHFDVPVPGPGTSVTFTILSVVGIPCINSLSLTCNSTCTAAQKTAPTFTTIPSFCSGTIAPLLPVVSNEGITGTWSPALINNTTSGVYTFTPDNVLYPCALTQTMNITVTPFTTPTFAVRPPICNGDVIAPLPTTSTNGVTGTWSPALNNTTSTKYTFTPTAGQCATTTALTISVNPVVTPNFAVIPALCSGSAAPILATTSPNGITGAWSPATINNTVGGNYTFTPTAGQCANNQTLNVTITPRTVTNFSNIAAFCSGTTAPILATISPNGVNGTWNPAMISNTASGSYTFTPISTECATTQTLNVVVTPLVVPDFTDLSICSGSVTPVLATTSPNGITGIWSPSVIDNTTGGSYVFTPDAPQCATSKTINVTVNRSDTLTSISWTVTNAFSKNQIITITAASAGNYLYQLDSGAFQTNSVFENVSSGLHSITVQEIFGCSAPITENNILVINYPKFFTPNGDSFNDRWNIFDLSDQLNSRIYIFDRFGKLLKDISPLESGWDGNYIGQPMPADDYWFTVKYAEQNTIKEFKAHFTLKR